MAAWNGYSPITRAFHIAKGDHLAVIYSPQLYAAQVEYIEARRALNASGGLQAVRQAQEGTASQYATAAA